MQATINESTITFQLADAGEPRPRSAWRRWAEAVGWSDRTDRILARFLGEVGEATSREEVHTLLIRAAQELSGASRVEIRPIGGPNRVVLTRGAILGPSSEPIRLPIRFRGVPLGDLLVTFRDDRAARGLVGHLESLCSIAAIADRLLGRERHLRMTAPGGSEGDSRPRALLPPFLRQLVLLSRRRRESLTVLAIGLDRPIEGDDPVTAAVVGILRESDLVIQEDDRTLIAVLPNASSGNAAVIAESVVRAVGEAAEGAWMPSLGVGVACFPDDAKEADVLLDVALESLRRAREAGLGRIVVADREAFDPRDLWERGANKAS